MTYPLLLMFFFTEYVRPSSYWPWMEALHLNSIVPLSAFAGSLVGTDATTVSRVIGDKSSKIVAALMGLVWLAILTADVKLYVMNLQNILIGFVLVYWVLATQVNSVRRIKGVIMTLIVVHLVVAALNPVLFTDPQNRHYISSGAFLGDGNDFSLSIDIIVPFCVFLVLDSRQTTRKFLWASALLVLVAGVVSTQSRGGTLGLAAAGFYYWSKSSRKLQTGALAVVVIVLILALAPGAYFERMSSITDTQEGSALGRITAWRAATRMALDNPLTGVGPSHFPMKFGTTYRPDGFVGVGMAAHSMYFLALGELGFPGLILLIWLIAHNVMANRRVADLVRAGNSPSRETDLQLLAAASASMFALAVAGAFLSALYYPHLYVLSGILTALRRVVTDNCTAAVGAVAPASAPAKMTLHWSLQRPAGQAWQNRTLGERG